ncbi:POT family MFS transporter [Ferruginibacter sp. SUN002]|uniref:POT family MFS transporter n=1 Tax=Ferruginibacter sp. SUN002 TaxID=2937789 RepID=UPI003D35B1AC
MAPNTTDVLTDIEEKKGKFPKAVPYIIGNEAAERFSYYGMRAILSTFLVAQFFNATKDPALTAAAEARSNELVHYFVALAYFMPLVGGILADSFFGKYKVIFYVSILYTIGHLILSLATNNLSLFTVGLIVIAISAGGIKSSVSANVGDQFDKSNKHLMSKVYGWFYFSINAGSVFSTILIPYLYKEYGADIAFGVPGILMAIATFTFWLGRKKYVRVPPSGLKKENFFFIVIEYFKQLFSNRNGKTVWQAVAQKYSAKSADGVKAVFRVLAVFAFIPIFWAMWDMCLAEWVIQAEKMDLTVFGHKYIAEQIQTVNPIFVLSCIPLFTYFVYPFFDRVGLKTTPLRRIGAGLILTALSFVIIALIQEKIDAGGHPSIWWQILAYFVLSVGEILVSITGLEYAYTQAPKSMKSTMNAIWLLTVSVGNLFVAAMNGNIASGGYFSKFTGASYYWLYVGILSGFIIVYLLVSSRLKEKSYIVGEDEDAALLAESKEP